MATIDFADEIARYRIEDWIERDLGEFEGKSGVWRTACCPFHPDDDPSFGVNVQTQRWCCFAGCGSGDLLDYIQLRRFGNIDRTGSQVLEALKVVTGQDFLPPVMRDHDSKPETARKDPPSMEIVRRCAQWADMAAPYFHSRMLSDQTIHERLLGLELEREWKPLVVKSTGETFQMKRRHYTIPNVLDGLVRGVNTRRDDSYCEEQIRTDKGRYAYEQVAGEIAERSKISILDVKHGKVMDKLFGPKYWKMPGSQGAIFNAQRLVKTEFGRPLTTSTGEWLVNRPPYVLVVESEIDALSLEDAGYPAVALSRYEGLQLARAFAGVRSVVIIADNDKDQVDPRGLPWNPGQNKAAQAQKAIGRGDIIYPPAPFKDSNELLKAGEFKAWIGDHSILPCLEPRRV